MCSIEVLGVMLPMFKTGRVRVDISVSSTYDLVGKFSHHDTSTTLGLGLLV